MEDFFVHSSSIVEENCHIGKGTKIWHFSHIMFPSSIGEHCVIGQNVFIGAGVSIGNRVKVQNNVSLYSGVECEEDVFLGPSCVFTNVINPRSAINRREKYQLTRVCRGASIGANATIVCGNEIGAYSFIGAGAVVTKDIPPYSLWVGNPAQQIGWISEYGHRLNFDETSKAVCPESNEVYVIEENSVRKLVDF